MSVCCARRGGFFTYYGRVTAILVGLLFSFLNEHLDEPVEMLSFPPSTSVSMIYGSRSWLNSQQHFVIHVKHVLTSLDLYYYYHYYYNPFYYNHSYIFAVTVLIEMVISLS